MSDSKIQQIIDIVCCDRRTAQYLLELANGDLNEAINLGFSDIINNIPPESAAPKPVVEKATKPSAPKKTSEAPQPTSESAKRDLNPPVANPNAHYQPARGSHSPPTNNTAKKAPPTSMAEILEEQEEEERERARNEGRNEDYYNGGASRTGGSNTKMQQPNDPDGDKKDRCFITFYVYSNGLLLNRHLPFFSFEDEKNKKLFDEMKGTSVLPKVFLDSLPKSERPKPNQIIAADVVTSREEFRGELPRESAPTEEDMFHTVDPKAETKTISFDEIAARTKARRLIDEPVAPAPVPARIPKTAIENTSSSLVNSNTNVKCEPVLKLDQRIPVEPIRVRTNEKSYTIRTNPDKHTLSDLLICLKKAGIAVTSTSGFKIVTGPTTLELRGQELYKTIKENNVSKKLIVLFDFGK